MVTAGRLRGDAGQVAGIEAVPFGLLVLTVGVLLVAHTWAVVDAKFVTTAAAREAARAYVEAPLPGLAEASAMEAARRRGRAIRARSRDPAPRPGVERVRALRAHPVRGRPRGTDGRHALAR